jgi:hypothetical protein
MYTNVALPLPSNGNLSYSRHIVRILKKIDKILTLFKEPSP